MSHEVTSDKAENFSEEECAEPAELFSCGSQDSLRTRQKHSVGKRDVVCGHVVRRVKDQVDSIGDKI